MVSEEINVFNGAIVVKMTTAKWFLYDVKENKEMNNNS